MQTLPNSSHLSHHRRIQRSHTRRQPTNNQGRLRVDDPQNHNELTIIRWVSSFPLSLPWGSTGRIVHLSVPLAFARTTSNAKAMTVLFLFNFRSDGYGTTFRLWSNNPSRLQELYNAVTPHENEPHSARNVMRLDSTWKGWRRGMIDVY